MPTSAPTWEETDAPASDIPSWEATAEIAPSEPAAPSWEETAPAVPPSPQPPSLTPASDAVAAATAYGQRMGGPTTAEEIGMEQQFQASHPQLHGWLVGAGNVVKGMVPTSWEQARQMVKPPIQAAAGEENVQKSQEELAQDVQQWGEMARGEHGPVAQAETIIGAAVQAAPLLHLPFAKSPIRAPLRPGYKLPPPPEAPPVAVPEGYARVEPAEAMRPPPETPVATPEVAAATPEVAPAAAAASKAPDYDSEGIGAKEWINRRVQEGVTREQALQEQAQHIQDAVDWGEALDEGTTIRSKDGKIFKKRDGQWVAEDGSVLSGAPRGAEVVTRGAEPPAAAEQPPTVVAEPAPPEPAPAAAPTEGVSVPVMITRKMEADLRAKGYEQGAIDKMTPQQANDILRPAPPEPAPPAAAAAPREVVSLPNWREGGFIDKPAVFLRFGEPPKEGPSGRYLEGKRISDEAGVSAVHAWRDPKTGKYVIRKTGTEDIEGIESLANRKAYVVEGEPLKEVGGDEEPLLKAGTVRVVGEVPMSQITTDSLHNIALDGTEWAEHETPDWTQPDVKPPAATVPTTGVKLSRGEIGASGTQPRVAEPPLGGVREGAKSYPGFKPAIQLVDTGEVFTGGGHQELRNKYADRGRTRTGYADENGKFHNMMDVVRAHMKEAPPLDVSFKSVGGAEPPLGGETPAAEASVGPGGASREEYMQRYASVGASEILKGNVEQGRFSQALVTEFGTQISDMLPEIYERSKQLVNKVTTEFPQGTGKSAIAREINRQAGISRIQMSPVRLNLMGALRDSLRTAERAGVAGYKRGVKEATVAGTEAVRKAKATAATADAWLAADANEIRSQMLSFAQHLPLHERGKFIPAITSALRRAPIFSRDPGVMYRRAEAVLNRMTEKVYDVKKKDLVGKIEKLLEKTEASQSIAVAEKQAIRARGVTFRQLQDKMSVDMLERMHDAMQDRFETGQDIWKLDQATHGLKVGATLRDIQQQGIRKVDRPVEAQRALGETENWWSRQVNRMRAIPNAVRHFNLTLTPMDWLFQTFDKRSNGALYQNMKVPVDIRWNEYMDAAHSYKERLSKVARAYKLDEGNFDRIYAHAELRQDGGLENLKALGYSDKEINSARVLKPGERAYLKEADTINNELFPKVKDVLEKSYHQEIEKVPGYFPRQRDWDYYNALSIEEGKFARALNRKNTEKGFTISRTGATTKNITNAHDVMMKHIDDVLYHINMGPQLRMLADVVKSPEFGQSAGTWGQKIFSDWVDVLARNGGVEAGRRMGALDVLRKNVGMAQLAFRLTTTGLQPLSIIQGLAVVSPKNMARSLSSMASSAHRNFILKNFPEIRARVGDDPAYSDYKGASLRDIAARAGFKGISVLDRFAAMTVAEGAYRDSLAKRGIPFDMTKVDPLGVQEAQAAVRKTQSSAYTKDVPLAISRGNFTGNVSVDRAIFQFQNFLINKWALVKNGALQMGIEEKSPVAGARIMSFLILGTIAEQMGRDGIRRFIQASFGQTPEQARDQKKEEKEGKTYARKIGEKATVDLLTSIPIVSNVTGISNYEGAGIPVVDVLRKTIIGATRVATGKKPQTKITGGIQAAAGIGGLMGVPTSQAADIITQYIRSHQPKKHKVRGVRAPVSRGR